MHRSGIGPACVLCLESCDGTPVRRLFQVRDDDDGLVSMVEEKW